MGGGGVGEEKGVGSGTGHTTWEGSDIYFNTDNLTLSNQDNVKDVVQEIFINSNTKDEDVPYLHYPIVRVAGIICRNFRQKYCKILALFIIGADPTGQGGRG